MTASNAGKILFLVPAAIEFLKFNPKAVCNKLEEEVYTKLQDKKILKCLQADALMFHHIYADLVLLAKSNELNKTVFDMNCHYLELKSSFEEIEAHPNTVLDSSCKVFVSESRLYGSTELNHRNHSSSQLVQKCIFQEDSSDVDILFPLIVAGVRSMKYNNTVASLPSTINLPASASLASHLQL